MKKLNIFNYILLILLLSSFSYSINEYPAFNNPYNATYCWHFNEGAGNIATDSISGMILELSSFSWNTTSLNPFANSYIYSQTGNMRCNTTTQENNTQGKITFSFWIYPETPSSEQNLIHKWTTTNSYMIAFGALGGGTYADYVWTSSNGVNNFQGSGGYTPKQKSWTHFVYILDPAKKNIALFINGTFVTNNILAPDSTGNSIYPYKNIISISGAYGSNSKGFRGGIDEFIIFNHNLSTTEIMNLYTGNIGYYTVPVFENPTPLDNDADNTQRIINISCLNSNVTLFFSNDTNLTNVINGFNHGSLFDWITNVTLSDTYYYKASCDNGTLFNTTIRKWIYDIDTPILKTNFINNTIIYLGNLSAQFNASDNIILHGFNISIDGITLYNISHIHNTFFNYDFFYYNPKLNNLAYGTHLINIRVTDGHTAKKLYSPNDIEVTTPLIFDNELNYKIKPNPYEKNEFSISTKSKDLLDKWEFEIKKDKITEKLTAQRPSPRMSFTFKSDKKIYIAEKTGKYGGKWLITGDKWKDFVIKGDSQAYIESINLINSFEAEIIINNIQNPSIIEFESTGDLNIINRQYFFSYNNLSVNSVLSLPSPALSNEDLKGYCNASESSENNLTIGYIWYKNKQILEANIYNYQNSLNLNQTPIKTTLQSGLTSYTFINYSNPFLRDFKISYNFESINYNSSNSNCLNSIISIRRSSSAIVKEISCYNYNTNLYESIATAGELETLYYNGLYLNTSKPLNISNQLILIKTLDKKNLTEGDNFTFSCGAINNNLFTGYTNSSVTNILTLNLGLCDGSLIYPVFNLTSYDEVTKEKIATNKGYNLKVYDSVNYKNLSLSTINTISDNFCTNINPVTKLINWSIWNNILITKEGYATRLYETDESLPITVYNSNQKNLSYYLISLVNSTTISYNWFTTSYQRISGIQNIYRCNGDNTKTLVESTPIIDGSSVANIELLNIPYSYTIIYNGKEYIDENSYTKCHIEVSPVTAISYYIDISEQDFNNYLLLDQLDCNFTKTSSSQATLKWSVLSGVSGKILIYRNNEFIGEVSNDISNFIYNLPDNIYNYNLIAYLKLNNNLKSCSELSFNQNKTNSQLLGLMGAFACFILLAGLVLLFAGEKEKTLLIMAIGLLSIFILGLSSLSWQSILSMISLILLTIFIGRYIRK